MVYKRYCKLIIVYEYNFNPFSLITFCKPVLNWEGLYKFAVPRNDQGLSARVSYFLAAWTIRLFNLLSWLLANKNTYHPLQSVQFDSSCCFQVVSIYILYCLCKAIPTFLLKRLLTTYKIRDLVYFATRLDLLPLFSSW